VAKLGIFWEILIVGRMPHSIGISLYPSAPAAVASGEGLGGTRAGKLCLFVPLGCILWYGWKNGFDYPLAGKL